MSCSSISKAVVPLALAFGMAAVLLPLAATASSISNVSVTQMSFDDSPYVPGFMGGDGSIGAGVDLVNERRMALDTIPRVFDWAYWDPSGLGANVDTGGPYHAGRQVQWESKFSDPSADDLSAPNGLISPANLDSLGVGWNLDTGTEVAQSGQGGIRMTDSGRVGLRIDPGDAANINGQKFHLEMNIPDGRYAVSLFMEDRKINALTTLNFPGVAQVDIGPIPDANAADEIALQFDVTNDSGSAQMLTFDWGDLNDTIDDLDIRFSAGVIQVIPEPSSLLLVLLGMPLLAGRRRT